MGRFQFHHSTNWNSRLPPRKYLLDWQRPGICIPGPAVSLLFNGTLTAHGSLAAFGTLALNGSLSALGTLVNFGSVVILPCLARMTTSTRHFEVRCHACPIAAPAQHETRLDCGYARSAHFIAIILAPKHSVTRWNAMCRRLS